MELLVRYMLGFVVHPLVCLFRAFGATEAYTQGCRMANTDYWNLYRLGARLSFITRYYRLIEGLQLFLQSVFDSYV